MTLGWSSDHTRRISHLISDVGEQPLTVCGRTNKGGQITKEPECLPCRSCQKILQRWKSGQ